MDQTALLALSAATLAQTALSAHLLFLRSVQRQAYLPMAIFFISMGIVLSLPIFSAFLPQFQSTVVAFSLPALLLLGPSLWLYVEGLTSETRWHFCAGHYRHFVLFGFGVVIALIAISLPNEMREALLVRGEELGLKKGSIMERNVATIALIAAFVLILIWVAQSAYYAVRIIGHLARYRMRLKDLFASTVSREMKWLSSLLFAVGVVWLMTAITIFSDNFFNKIFISSTVSQSLIFIMIWSLSAWAFRQKPGFEELYKDDELEYVARSVEQKYERSALTKEQSSLVAKKIEVAIGSEKLYLDSSLSLQKLSKVISVSPNYISQTLNETIGMNFFDYVNSHRVEAAKILLAHGEDTVLDIAMNVGFNAKSSFYAAFKKITRQTPTAFRKTHGQIE